MPQKLYRIKEIADVFNISIDTLRIYEKLGILSPAYVNPNTNYRYYGVIETAKLKYILSLKAMGFTLQEIKKLMCGEIDLEKKKEQLLMQIDQIKQFLLLFDKFSETTDYKATIKTLPAHYVLKSEKRLDSWRDVLTEYDNLTEQLISCKLQQSVTSTPYAIFYDKEFRLTDVSCSVYLEVCKSDNPCVLKMPAQKYLTCIHHGAYESLKKAYDFLYRYAEKKGIKIIGFPMERYLVSNGNQTLSPDFITELCLPIKND